MDSTFNELVENLSFQVVAGPCNQNIFNDMTPKSIGTPVNVKVKFRRKDDVHRGVISVPKFENIKLSKNLRLINSDQTIFSFDVLMDMKASEKPTKKSQKKVFQIFRPGICLGSKNNDDDTYAYVPSIIENETTTFSATKVNVMNNENRCGLKKNIVIDDINRTPKMFLGKCKPGGCLDPPFGEERYAYEPMSVKEDIAKCTTIDKVVNSQLSVRSYSRQLRSRSPLKEKEKNLESKLYDELLITYPQSHNYNDNKDILKTNNTIEKSSKLSSDTYIQSYYKPPRSKETSISSNRVAEDVQNLIDNEMRINPTHIIATNYKSPSKDSIYKQTGGPAEPVLPMTANLSTIESNLTSFLNNQQCDMEQNIEQTKECLADNISKSGTGTGKNQEPLENHLQYLNTFPQLNNNVEQFSVTDILRRISDDIKTSPEIFESIPNNKINLLNGAQIDDKQADEQSIIVIAPVRDLRETLTNDDDSEYLLDYYDKKQTEFREDYNNTQYIDQNNDTADKFESQIFQINLQKQPSSILQENVSNISNNDTLLQKNEKLDYSYQKSEIKKNNTNSSKSKLPSQINIKGISSESTQVINLSTEMVKDKISDLEDLKIENDAKNSQKDSDVNISQKISVTDNKEPIFKENTLTDKDIEERRSINKDAKDSIASVKNTGNSLKPYQESIQNISLLSTRNSMAQIINGTVDDDLDSIVDITKSDNRPVSPNVIVESSQATLQKSQKSFDQNGDSQNNPALESLTQQIIDKNVLKDSNAMEKKVSNLSNPSIKTLNKAPSLHKTSILEDTLSELNNNKYTSNKEVYEIATDVPDSLKKSNITQHINSFESENFPISTNQISETIPTPSIRNSLEKNNFDGTEKGEAEKISLENELDQVLQTEISQHTQSDEKEHAETFIKPQLSNIILKKYAGTEKDLQKTSKLNINSIANIHPQLPNATNDKTDVNIKEDKTRLFSIKNESKHLEVKPTAKHIRSKDNLKLLHNNSSKGVANNNVFQLDVALKSYVNNNNERAFKTIDSVTAPDNNDQESVLLFKTKLRVNEDEMKLPIDPYTDIVVLVKRNSPINTEDTRNKHFQDALYENEKHSRVNGFQETMSTIYEQTLIPVQNMLQALKDDVEHLARNQILIREMLRNKSKPTRLINVNRRCSCYRK